MLKTFSYSMNAIAYKELLKRCKGNIQMAKNEILRGLNIPLSHKEFTKLTKKGDLVEVYISSSYVNELDEIIVQHF